MTPAARSTGFLEPRGGCEGAKAANSEPEEPQEPLPLTAPEPRPKVAGPDQTGTAAPEATRRFPAPCRNWSFSCLSLVGSGHPRHDGSGSGIFAGGGGVAAGAGWRVARNSPAPPRRLVLPQQFNASAYRSPKVRQRSGHRVPPAFLSCPALPSSRHPGPPSRPPDAAPGTVLRGPWSASRLALLQPAELFPASRPSKVPYSPYRRQPRCHVLGGHPWSPRLTWPLQPRSPLQCWSQPCLCLLVIVCRTRV